MYALVLRQLRMERRRHDLSFAHQHGITIALRQHFNPVTDVLDSWSTNEDHLQRITAELSYSLDDAGIDLSSIGVAPDRHVDSIQAGLMRVFDLLGQQDRTGARPKRRLVMNEIAELLKSLFTQQLQKRAGLATRNDQAADLIKLLGLAHEYDISAEFFQSPPMGFEITLQCEDADFWHAIRHSLFARGKLSAVSLQLSVNTSKLLDYRDCAMIRGCQNKGRELVAPQTDS